jgi:hypothetical protein
MKANKRTHQPTMTTDQSKGHCKGHFVTIYHIHYSRGTMVSAVLKHSLRTAGRWTAHRLYPSPRLLSRHNSAHKALEAIGADPREVLGPGALKRAGIE